MASVIQIKHDQDLDNQQSPSPEELLKLKQRLDFNLRLATKKTREANALKAVLSDAYQNSKTLVDKLQKENARLHNRITKLRKQLEEVLELAERSERRPRQEPDHDDMEDLGLKFGNDCVGSVTDIDVECGFNLKGF